MSSMVNRNPSCL